MTTNAQRVRPNCRRGTTVVETALVLPVFLLFVLGLIELGHAQLVKHVLRSACRQAARIGSTEGNSTADVQAEGARRAGRGGRSGSGRRVREGCQRLRQRAAAVDERRRRWKACRTSNSHSAEPRQLFLVRAKVHYNDIAIVPNIPYLGNFLDDVVLEGQAFMRHE